MVQKVLPGVLFGLMKAVENLYYTLVWYSMNQVKALSARDEAHDVVDAVYSVYHYPHIRCKHEDGA